MKKFFFLFIVLFTAIEADAQIMRAAELEKYAKEQYGDSWVEAAANLASTITLDKNNSLTMQEVIECPGKSKNDLYILLNYWFTQTFNDANSVIQLNDKEAGTIIGKGYVEGIAENTGTMSHFTVSISPIIKADIKDEKVRVTYTIQNYDILRAAGGGGLGIAAAALGGGPVKVNYINEKWAIETCYPFVEKDEHKAKKTSSKALIMTNAYSQVIMDKIKEAVTNGLTGADGDDW